MKKITKTLLLGLALVATTGTTVFAEMKRHHYSTIFINQDNHHIVSMISSRDIGDVANELKKFVNLKESDKRCINSI